MYLIRRLFGFYETLSVTSIFSPLLFILLNHLPILGKVACGEPICDAQYEGYAKVGTNIKRKADFCLVAIGGSMIGDRILENDIVLIRSQPQVENGEIAAVVIGEEVTLKHVYYSPTGITLVASNSSYPPRTFMADQLDEVRILGKYVGFISMVSK